jgi:hypothetical protein
VKNVEHRHSSVEVLADDASLTGSAGMVCVREVVRALGLVGSIDGFVDPIKRRNRGVTAGEFVVSLAECLLDGGDFLADLDRARADEAGAALRTVAMPPASTTAATLAMRFGPDERAGVQVAWAEAIARAVGLMPAGEQRRLAARVTLDADPTDIEVYGAKKHGVAYNYLGQRAGRAFLVTWAELGVVLAAELFAGNDDPRPVAGDLIGSAIECLPAGLAKPCVRADAGFFDQSFVRAALDADADVAVGVKRNTAVMRAIRAVADDAWRPALGMHGAEVAEADYQPAGWPTMRAIVRRVRHDADSISADPRSRRARTMGREQLRLVLDGTADHAFAYSMILTTLDDDPVEIEHWFRGRVSIEDRIRDAKLGFGLRHLPSGKDAVNQLWLLAAVSALNLSALTQALDPTGPRAHAKRLRFELLAVPGRIARHARRQVLHVPPRAQRLARAHRRLRLLPSPSG